MKKHKLAKSTLFNVITAITVFSLLVVLGVMAFVAMMVGNEKLAMISGALFIVIALLYIIACFTLIMIAIAIANMEDDEDDEDGLIK